MFVVLTAHADTALKVAGLNLGVDDYLTKPLEASELIAKVRATLRIKALHDQIRADRATLATLHAELAGSFDHLLALLVHLLDLRVSGAELRGQRLAVAAVRLATRFEMPEEYRRDLELGAMLHEIGRIADTAPEDSAAERGLEPEVSGGDWRYTVTSAAILSRIERLRAVADLVGCISENWDGTGFPGHMRQGQIPLRSRILRVLADFFADIDRASPGVTPQQSAAHLARRSGTWYDPMVVSQLEALVQESPDLEWRASRRRIPLDELESGMRLADDLLTSSGTKLLSAGAMLTGSSLEAIRRRHLSDPVVYGVLVDS
jgi:response regulator RpfG family c-di-GMP phosphodiesterase